MTHSHVDVKHESQPQGLALRTVAYPTRETLTENHILRACDIDVAVALGYVEAMVLHQVNFLMGISNNIVDGRKWTYHTYKEWQDCFPFFGEDTIKRAIRRLEHKGILLSGKFNRSKIDKTKWYTIDDERFD